MNSKRTDHGMGVVTIDGEDRLAVFGGQENKASELDSVELYNAKSEKWETTDIKLNGPKSEFGFLTVKLSNVIPELQCTVPDLLHRSLALLIASFFFIFSLYFFMRSI